MPIVDNLRASPGITAGTHGERDAFVVERYGRLGIAVGDAQQEPSAPEVVALTFDKLAR